MFVLPLQVDKIAQNITKIFKESNIKAEESAINLIATAGEGSMRDALSIADMCASFCNNDITYDKVIDVLGISNKQVIYAPIWCHNDIMQVLLQFGIFMLAIYLITIIKAMILHLKDENKFSKIIIIL